MWKWRKYLKIYMTPNSGSKDKMLRNPFLWKSKRRAEWYSVNDLRTFRKYDWQHYEPIYDLETACTTHSFILLSFKQGNEIKDFFLNHLFKRWIFMWFPLWQNYQAVYFRSKITLFQLMMFTRIILLYM